MTFKKQYLAQSISLILLTSVAASASAEDQAAVKLDTLEVNAQDTNPDSYTAPDAATATKMNLSLRETPQAVAVITQAQLDDFNATDLNAALDLTAGVTVERIETDRSYYTARGFDITNFQLDGVGLPTTSGNLFGDIDSAIAERIEVLKGANGLMSGTGNPSATVNIIR
ncbi:TonB-dependent receptor plug domain-containing protein, partial [Oceanospirillum sp. HFRX-1_2]